MKVGEIRASFMGDGMLCVFGENFPAAILLLTDGEPVITKNKEGEEFRFSATEKALSIERVVKPIVTVMVDDSIPASAQLAGTGDQEAGGKNDGTS